MSATTWVDQPNTVFRNLANGKFAALTEAAGFSALPPRRHRGSAVGDFNHDGKLDIVVTALSSPAEIWINDSPGTSHWIELRLQGTRSNRDAIGAKIRIKSAGQTQYDQVTHTSGYASSSAAPVHFGLAGASVVDEIEIQWPSGISQKIQNVSADHLVVIKEPATGSTTLSR